MFGYFEHEISQVAFVKLQFQAVPLTASPPHMCLSLQRRGSEGVWLSLFCACSEALRSKENHQLGGSKSMKNHFL